jgi:hypothetical protein
VLVLGLAAQPLIELIVPAAEALVEPSAYLGAVGDA